MSSDDATIVGVEIRHILYCGGGPALIAVVAGHVDMMFADVAQVGDLVNDGKVIALGTPNEVQNHPEVVRAYIGGEA